MATILRAANQTSTSILAVTAASTMPATAVAGMPAITLHDMARLRLEVVSFFLVVLLLSAGVVLAVWNWLRNDLAWLPRLTYPKAVAVVTLWGILFVIVLTMISGARELMTPGAWERNGWTYRLSGTEAPNQDLLSDLEIRRQGLQRLSEMLVDYAYRHDGRFPTQDEFDQFPQEALRVPGRPGFDYVYVSGRTIRGTESLLIHEPTVYGEESLALFTGGRILATTAAEIDRLRSIEQTDDATHD